MIVRTLRKRLKMPEEVVKRYNKFTVRGFTDIMVYIEKCREDTEWRTKELYFHPRFFRYKTITRPGVSWYTYFKEIGFDALKQNRLNDAEFEYMDSEEISGESFPLSQLGEGEACPPLAGKAGGEDFA